MNADIDNRGVSPVIATILMVALTVVIATSVGVAALGLSDDLQDLTAPMTYGDNLIENPGFENGDASWEFVDEDWNTVEIADGEGVDGSNAIRLQSDDDYTAQNLDAVLLPDAEYRLCAQSRLDFEGGGQAWIGVQHATGSGDIQLATWEVTWTNYRNNCVYFKADRELEDITVWVYTSGDVSVLADDFVLQRTKFLTDAR